MPTILNCHTAALILSALALPLWARTAPEKNAPAAAVRTRLQAFYTYHFSHPKEFTRKTLDGRRKWLASGFYDLLRYELGRKLPPDEAPYIEGDPFTNSQEYPARFRVGDVRVSGAKADADVHFTWTVGDKVVSQRKCNIKLAREGGAWRIADIVGGDGRSLAGDLRRLKRDDTSARP
jgi:hypothetical protein